MEVCSAQRSNILTKLIPFQNLHRLSENIHRNISQIPPAPHPASPNKSLAKAAIREAIVYYFPEGQEVFRKMWCTKNSPTQLEKKRNKQNHTRRLEPVGLLITRKLYSLDGNSLWNAPLPHRSKNNFLSNPFYPPFFTVPWIMTHIKERDRDICMHVVF